MASRRPLHLLRLLLVLLPLSGVWLMAQGGYIHAKAWLAQILLESAWADTLDGHTEVKPWPWADTWPVARLSVPRLGIRRIVLAGASGSALAFGPGLFFPAAVPGEADNTIIAGHRDTHFAFLGNLRVGDRLELETARAERLVYRVTQTAIVHKNEAPALLAPQAGTLSLVTCYPFTAVRPGGPLRYVVSAGYRITRELL